MPFRGRPALFIAIVGPCGSGKTTLAENLIKEGYRARQIAQEHSFAPRMWQVIAKPDILIFLEACFEICQERKRLNWNQSDHDEQLRRLSHARKHCDLFIQTDQLTPKQVLDIALRALRIGQA